MNGLKSLAVFAFVISCVFSALGGIQPGSTAISVGPRTKPQRSDPMVVERMSPSTMYGLSGLGQQVVLAPLDMAAIREQDARREAGEKAVRIGVVRGFPSVSPHGDDGASGQWTALPDGSHIWRAGLTAEGAFGIRVRFGELDVPEGCELWVFGGRDPMDVAGPYTPPSWRGRNEFWAGTVFSDSVVVECYCPPGVSPGRVAFALDKIAHIYRNPLSTEREGGCHNNVACYPAWAAEARGVAGIGTIGASDVLWCTGCLLNVQSPAPPSDYFMTANHCVKNQAEADGTEYYWFFQMDVCVGPPPDIKSVPRTGGGADFLAGINSDDGNDFAFLRLRIPSPDGVVYVGWTLAPPSPSETLTGIHHPDGAYKRISFGNLTGSDNNYWYVRWFSGVTEMGSSGSPLFDGGRRFVGQLLGGQSSCEEPAGIDDYGRFDVTYPYISYWLSDARGNLNLDGRVDTLDGVVLICNIAGLLPQGTGPFTAPLAAADINLDGVVSDADLASLFTHLAQ